MNHTYKSFFLLIIFMLICFGIGYAGLARFQPHKLPTMSDAASYYKMTQFHYTEVPAPFRFRLLIPGLAGMINLILSKLFLGTWNSVCLSLLVVNSFFVSLTALVLIEISKELHIEPKLTLLSAFIYMVSFPVLNGHLIGLVDAGEGFFIAVLILMVLRNHWFLVSIITMASALVRETTPIFMGVYLISWWFLQRVLLKDQNSKGIFYWLFAIVLGVMAIYLIKFIVGGDPYAGHEFSLEILSQVPGRLIDLVKSKTLIYTFSYLLPIGLLGIKQVPKALVVSSCCMGAAAILLGAYGGIGSNISRPLFNTMGPMLIISSTMFLGKWFR